MIFWLILCILTLIIALISFYPLLRKQAPTTRVVRDELNKAFYFDRLKEIERDEQQGLLDNGNQLKTELQQALLEDIPAQEVEAEDKKSYGKIWFASGFLTILILPLSIYFNIGAWRAESQLEKIAENLPHFYQRMQEEDSNPLSETEMQQFSIALRLHLQQQPQDAKSWWLLGQLGMNLDNAQLAFDSYAKAAQLEPENSEYKLSYARILLFSEDPRDKAKGEELLKAVIRQDHTNYQALSLLALNYFEKEDYKMAAVSWAMLLRLLPEKDSRIPLIENSIRAARDALAEQEQEKTQNSPPETEKK